LRCRQARCRQIRCWRQVRHQWRFTDSLCRLLYGRRRSQIRSVQ
jgi:hypothetical protein